MLRYYDQLGILVPKSVDAQTGYRRYTLDQMVEIDVIRMCVESGIPLAELAAIQEAYPFLIRDDLPSTTYTGMTGDVVCVAIQATLVASKDLSEDVVYEFVKAMFDNKDALTEGHAKFGFLDPETASAGATVTMHPGAEKYYKEIGVL